MPTTTVRGLLLISDRGEAYFIESGIRAYKLQDEPQYNSAESSGVIPFKTSDLPARTIALSELQKQAKAWRDAWQATLPKDVWGTIPANLGPIIFQAYNVEVQREDYGDGVI